MTAEHRPNSDRTDLNTDETAVLVTVAEAAAQLGLSTDAVRMRVRRGTLSSTEVDGRRFVLLPRPNGDATEPDTDQSPTEPEPNAVPNRPDTSELVEQLRSEVSYLRQTLDAEIEARRRADHLVAGMIEELRALQNQVAKLEAGATAVAHEHEAEHRPNGDRTEANTEDAAVGPVEAPQRVGGPHMTLRTLQEGYSAPVPAQVTLATNWRRWWRRITGHEG